MDQIVIDIESAKTGGSIAIAYMDGEVLFSLSNIQESVIVTLNGEDEFEFVP
jgi:hypothetical protein